jgi:hypothetical protein
MTGTWAASQIHRISSCTSARREAAFDGQVPAGDHDAAARRAHGGQQHGRQILETAPGFDFQDDGGQALMLAMANLLPIAVAHLAA